MKRAQSIARRLLDRRALVAGDARFTIEEVEVYLRSEPHPDPFVHAHPSQRRSGRFYFHRQGDSYRGGSFKGLDVTLGGPDAIGGVLLRTLRRPDGALVSGPSLCVDALLEATGRARVAELDAAIGGRRADDATSVLRLTTIPSRSVDPLATARVGLTLKRHTPGDRRPAFLMRRYRLLTAPRAIKKGRVHTVIALHQDGLDPEAIHRATGSPRASVARILARYEQGRRQTLAALADRPLSTATLALLHGAWTARFAPDST